MTMSNNWIYGLFLSVNALVVIVNNNHPNNTAIKSSKRYNHQIGASPKYIQLAHGNLLIDKLPVGYVKNGSVDYTYYIQQAIDTYDTIIFPGFPLLVNDTGLNIPSNKTLIFENGSEIRLKPSDKAFYNIFNIENVDNVTLKNPKIVGDRNNHLGDGGEAGVGIGIRGATNITIFGGKISECWGDGIYIGQYQKKINCKNIAIKNTTVDRNRRDGISIISVDNLLLENFVASNSNGIKPMAGINFEPNNSDCLMDNIKVLSPVTRFNTNYGIQIGIKRMLGNGNRKADITIQNHTDIGSSKYSFNASCDSKFEPAFGTMTANIKVINPVWENPKNGLPVRFSTNQPNFRVAIMSPKVSTMGQFLSKKDISKLIKQEDFDGIAALSLVQ